MHVYGPHKCIKHVPFIGSCSTRQYCTAHLDDLFPKKSAFQYVFVTGGCASFPGFKERLERELLAMRPFQSQFSVYNAENPVTDAWYGARKWARDPALMETYGLTRKDFEEKGGEYFKEHIVTNTYFPTPFVPAKEIEKEEGE